MVKNVIAQRLKDGAVEPLGLVAALRMKGAGEQTFRIQDLKTCWKKQAVNCSTFFDKMQREEQYT